ncbi:non-ribosomal peptide synthetase [Aquimarina pacifica]|uniref:non-ribosomal peptide synthetase n=1 Tax=Aquimarina pacifica TaxID=1296415 RepID=UPI00046F6E48|nr:non-ribosomal peptide synthetase [Aquimarina pacifica]
MDKLIEKLRKEDIFISLDQDNLKINFNGNQLSAEIVEELKANKNDLITYLKKLNAKSKYKDIPLVHREDNKYTLSSSQKRLWILSQFEDASRSYNMPFQVTLKGKYSIENFKKAIFSVVERHEILRTVFKTKENNEVFQAILPIEATNFKIEYQDFRKKEEIEKCVDQYIKEDSYRLFDLEQGPLLRASILQVSEEEFVFYYNMHHIICDAWSFNVLKNDVFQFYNFYNEGTPLQLETLQIQYKDYANWQQSQLNENALQVHKEFWINKKLTDFPRLNLPTSNSRPKVKTNNGRSLSIYLDKELTAGVQTFVSNQGGSMFMGLLSVFKLLLFKYTNQRELTVGTLAAGRDHMDLENQIGFYVNALVLSSKINPKDSFADFYSKVKEDTLEVFSHRTYPFDLLVEDLELKNDPGRNALFDILLVLQNTGETIKDYEIDPSVLDSIEDCGEIFSRFDLEINLKEVGPYLRMDFNFNTDLYEVDFIRGMMLHFKKLLSSVLSDINLPLHTYNCLSKLDQKELLTYFNDTEVNFKESGTIVDLFLSQVLDKPEAIAVSYEGTELTYKDLDSLSNQMANYLASVHALSKGDLVGVKVERSEWLVVSILALLKLGCAYVPIDPLYPSERISFIEEDSTIKLCITNTFLESFRSVFQDFSEEFVKVSVPNSSLAYMIYTSGSTGRPKGVMVSHGSLFNYLLWCRAYYFPSGEASDFGLYTSLSFDLTVTSLFLPMISGGKLTVFGSDNDISDLLRNYASKAIECIKLTPAHITILGSLGLEKLSANKAIIGGDILHPSQVAILRGLNPEIQIYNEYGPTEATVGCIVEEVNPEDSPILIGKPISNTKVYILDDNQSLVPKGVVGELYLGGDCLSMGYWNRPELTKERFVSDPFNFNNVIYRTGDIGYWTQDGRIIFLGRNDDQVKVQGYRIELGDVESTLLSHPSVEEGAIISSTNEEGILELIGCFTSRVSVSISDLRSFYKERQPDYMIPSHFKQLEELPLTVNGKVDRKALISMELFLDDHCKDTYEAPSNEIESKIITLWESILKREKIGVNDDFYELGGNSLKLIRLMNEYHKMFNVKLHMKALFKASSLLSHATLVASAITDAYIAIHPAAAESSYPLSFSQSALWMLSQHEERSVAYNIPVMIPLDGVHDISMFNKAVLSVISRHEILRTFFKEDDNNEVRQWVAPIESIDFKITYKDYRYSDQGITLANKYVQEDAYQEFNFSEAPLLRSVLFHISDEEYLLYFNMHHIITDEVSMNVLRQDVLKYYNHYVHKDDLGLSALPIQYKDFAVWQKKRFKEGEYDADRSYWLSKLSGELPVLDLPKQKDRPSIKTYTGYSLGAYIDRSVSAKLRDFCKKSGGSLFMGALSAWYVLFHKYTGLNDLVLGSPVSGRNHADLKQQIGCYTNNIALRQELNPSDNFNAFFSQVKESMLDNYAHQLYPFHRVCEELDLKNNLGRNYIFDVMFSFHIATEETEKVAVSYTDIIQEIGDVRSKLDILINFYEYGEYLYFEINYNTDIYDQATIRELMNSYRLLLEKLVNNPSSIISEINYELEIAKSKFNKNKQKLRLLSVK